MVGVHPMEDKPGFQVELAEHLVGGCSRLEKLAPPFLLRGRTFDLLFYYSLSFCTMLPIPIFSKSFDHCLCAKFKYQILHYGIMICYILIIFCLCLNQ